MKRTSPAYRPRVDPPCPSFAVGGTVIVRDGTVTFEQLRDAALAARGSFGGPAREVPGTGGANRDLPAAPPSRS